jgi:ribonuclease BN (tRNA processing enzyme)
MRATSRATVVLPVPGYHSTGASDAQISHLKSSHAPIAQVGGIAESAGLKTLVLSHLAPGSAGLVPDAKWISNAKSAFSGRVFRAHELQTLAVGQTRASA